jgi:hypothetical protein
MDRRKIDWHTYCAGRPPIRVERRRWLFWVHEVDEPQRHDFTPITVEHMMTPGNFEVGYECRPCGQRKRSLWLAHGDLIEQDIPDPKKGPGLYFTRKTDVRGRSRKEEAS